MEFLKKLFENYLKTISKLNITFIELGYLSDAKDENGLFITDLIRNFEKKEKIY